LSSNPFAPPQAVVADIPQSGAEVPALWNPNAAALWSLIFSPAFGAFLHMLNWQAMGQPAKAQFSRVWAIGTLVFIFVVAVLGTVIPALDVLPNSTGLVPLFAWYFSAARDQIKTVQERYGRDYPRRGWGKPILIAIGAIIALFAVAVAVVMVFGPDEP
jgi:hypothetical protein